MLMVINYSPLLYQLSYRRKLGLSEGPLAVGPGSIPGASASLLESIPFIGIPFSALMQGGGAWSYPNLMCQTLLTPHGSPYALGGVDEV